MALVNTKEMFKKAYDGGYAIGAFNINDMEIIQGIMSACAELKAPVILQVSSSARKYAHPAYLVKMVEAAVKENPDIPVALHLDHGPSFEMCKACIDDGFTSVMFDGSAKPYEENVEEARRVVEYAHKYNVTVEAELGKLAGVEDDVKVEDDKAQFTAPDEVQDFVTRTGVDSLAIAIGTSHGAYKFKPDVYKRQGYGRPPGGDAARPAAQRGDLQRRGAVLPARAVGRAGPEDPRKRPRCDRLYRIYL